ncbi:carbohydrate-binding module family 50 protein [Moniliophthora roreri MCA 2997]|uniref:Carbohydrate-binding module family 50 protein n=1 Tax=Moniliophthora roreri (strain MCA 2997) TaxID=1381753 RepID=V2XFZ8_MONRO|nr:carbohydrate-binding module family 50 protein [Moniliophthora roreri MCA 2997]
MRQFIVPLVAAAYTAAACTKSYTVKSGDNCDAIAAAQGVSSYQITRLNGENVCSLLQIGQVLCLADTTYDCQPVYVVQSGDFCFSIAENHGISITQFLADNPQLDPDSCPVYPGLSVCVSSTTPGGGSSTTSVPPSSTTSAPPPISTACTRLSTVQPGDSCDAIAQRNSVSIYNLQLINPPNTCSGLIAGQAICVDSPLVNCSAVYTVDGSEGGCFNIAQAQGISLSALLDLNPNVNEQCTNIYVGEVLCIAPRGTVTPPPSGECTRTYTVVSGDTCTSIAAKNSITNLQLAQLNPSMNCNILVPGDSVCSFSPAINICPNLVKVSIRDNCFDLAQNVSMSLDEWLSINPGINCDALLPGSVVCSAQGNATLPEVPSGSNPTAVPRCGSFNRQQQCCTKFSVAADLFSPLCTRANGCQDNCAGDPGVVMPTAAATPTTTIPVGEPARPTLPPPTCSNCTSTQCCSKMNTCEEADTWHCQSDHGCQSNCDNGSFEWVSPPGQSVLELGNFTFPPGDYSATDGNPCGVQCLPIEYGDCLAAYGCLYNCLEISYVDEIACGKGGNCEQVTRTVKHPFTTST